MWEQRRMCIAQTLYTHKTQSVLEVGCGEGNILSFLTGPTSDDEYPITKLVGIDISADALQRAQAALEPTPHDLRYPRIDNLRICLFLGDCTGPPIDGVHCDAVVCSEVIEHVLPTQVAALTNAVLGGYRPQVAIFTTPNAEFNVNFPGLGYGTPQAKFRDEDHKFEWTRDEFEQWARKSALDYGYSVEMRGIGLSMRNADSRFVACGGCTQMALFVRGAEREDSCSPRSKSEPVLEQPRLFASIEYPVYSQPRLPDKQLFDLVLEMAQLAAGNDENEGENGDSWTVSEDDLWEMLDVKHQFKRRSALRAWLDGQPETFTVVVKDDSNQDDALLLARRYRLQR
ncbi:hypothetical protein LPJ64_000184 [Coemansia asiatica]|uniref:Small RNA 2'-O-methyltransferase n=1 Tax=Coemansia asiatica TaxID=1052880 RepID=A0A9W7XRA3_9FUNG|nr:hypothetical protein LPJ64_000184 [Coemansia asiatica]KAJ2889241.1 hypothetical protein FB639_000018 [Coemansia asiatica]